MVSRMPRIVAITGGTGFVGRHLVARHVALGDEVRYLTRSRANAALSGATPYVGDLRSGTGLSSFAAGADVLYHCAAELQDPSIMDDVNVRGTEQLLAAAQGEVGLWVQLSSTGVYGPVRSGVVDEERLLAPANAYECSKATADELVLEYSQSGLRSVLVRPSNVYGSDMSNQSLFQMIRMINKGLFFYIGSPDAMANYLHVENLVDAMVLCAEAVHVENGREYIVSDHCRLEELVDVIAANLGRQRPSLRLPEPMLRILAGLCSPIPGFPLSLSRIDALTNRTIYSTERIEGELGYHNHISMADGMGELVRAWQNAQR